MRIFATLLIIFISLNAQTTQASLNKITTEMIDHQYKTLSALLGNVKDRRDAIEFMHNSIAQDAVIKVSADNPSVPNTGADQVFELSKADYINSYIQGAYFIENYNISIDVLDIEIAPNGQEAVTKEIIIEEGLAGSPRKQSTKKAFVSKTICETTHRLQNSRLVVTNGTCHTTVGIHTEI